MVQDAREVTVQYPPLYAEAHTGRRQDGPGSDPGVSWDTEVTPERCGGERNRFPQAPR
jgi:hypothetical protein